MSRDAFQNLRSCSIHFSKVVYVVAGHWAKTDFAKSKFFTFGFTKRWSINGLAALKMRLTERDLLIARLRLERLVAKKCVFAVSEISDYVVVLARLGEEGCHEYLRHQ